MGTRKVVVCTEEHWGLSDLAVQRYEELSGKKYTRFFQRDRWNKSAPRREQLDRMGYRFVERHDPHLVQAVEELGEGAECCNVLTIVEIEGGRYRILVCDRSGDERIETPDSIKWVTIEDGGV